MTINLANAMTPAEIDALTPEQLRIEVAVQVMGWVDIYVDRSTVFGRRPDGIGVRGVPDYPNDIAAAWTIVDKFKHMECLDDLYKELDTVPPLISMSAPDAAYAICLAALKAVQP